MVFAAAGLRYAVWRLVEELRAERKCREEAQWKSLRASWSKPKNMDVWALFVGDRENPPKKPREVQSGLRPKIHREDTARAGVHVPEIGPKPRLPYKEYSAALPFEYS